MKILLRAPLLTTSGYGVHSRQIFDWLNNIPSISLDVECLNWGMTPWMVNPSMENGLVGEIMKKSKATTPPYDITFQVQLPDEWDSSLGRKNVGISAFVETEKCNPAWLECCNKMDHIIVPSNFTKSVISRTGTVKKPVSVIPEWFNQEILDSDNNVLSELDFETDTNFLIVGQLNSATPQDDRKNIFNTIKWLSESLERESENIGIVIKTNMGKGTEIDRKKTINILKQMKNAINVERFPKIYLLHGNMSKKEIAALYKHPKVSCLVSATRGEGYGLPLIEAAASGLPVIATNWSGHLDFLKESFMPVDYKLAPINKTRVDKRIFFEGFRWAEPYPNSFKKCIIKFLKNKQKYNDIAKNHSSFILNNFGKQKTKKMYDEILSLLMR